MEILEPQDFDRLFRETAGASMNEIRQRFAETCALHAERRRLHDERATILAPIRERIVAGGCERFSLPATQFDRVVSIGRAISKSLDIPNLPEWVPVVIEVYGVAVERGA